MTNLFEPSDSEHEFRYVLEIYREDGERVGQAVIEADWEPAIEWTRLQRLRELGPGANGPAANPVIRPVWHSKVGEPYLHGFSVTFGGSDEHETAAVFPIQYFSRSAQAASSQLIELGELAEGELFRYLAMAYRGESVAHDPDGSRFTVEETSNPISILEIPKSCEELIAECEPHGSSQPGDMPVVMPECVLDQVTELTCQNHDREIGGILIGHLCWSTEERALCAIVTEQIPARHTVSKSTRLTFTSDTWTAVRAAIDLRRRNETILGWYHSHPIAQWRQTVEEDCDPSCASIDFFSEYDSALHRTVFAPAYCVALVVSHLGEDEISNALFGWRSGFVESRGFHVCADEIDLMLTDKQSDPGSES